MSAAQKKPRTQDWYLRGARVRFIKDNLGASRRDDLGHVTQEVFGVGDEGIAVFQSPSRNAARAGWFYVEVDSKREPGTKLYVGVHERMIEIGRAKKRLTWGQVLAGIAQGAINISEGLTTIEAGSRVHRSMEELCRKWQAVAKGEAQPAEWFSALPGYEEE